MSAALVLLQSNENSLTVTPGLRLVYIFLVASRGRQGQELLVSEGQGCPSVRGGTSLPPVLPRQPRRAYPSALSGRFEMLRPLEMSLFLKEPQVSLW